MKLSHKQLRRLIRERLILNELGWPKASEKLKIDPEISKVGDLRKLIKVMQSENRSEEGIGGLKDLGMGMLADLVPGGGTALSLAQTLKAMYSAPDDKKTDTKLDKLNVDDEVAMIVDDTVEENFLNVAIESIEGLDDDDDIPDINKSLADWLEAKYDARTVSGFNEGVKIRVTKSQLKKLIKEALLVEGDMDFEASEGRWTYQWAFDPTQDPSVAWVLSNDDGLQIKGSEMNRGNWPSLENSSLDDALSKFEDENKDHFEFNNGRAGVAFEKVAPAWAEIKFNRPENEDVDELRDAVNSVAKQIANSGG
jgi:hypothetical protein